MRAQPTPAPQPNGSVEAYLNAPYTRMLVPDTEDGTFVAEVLELPGCLSSGSSPAEAYENLQDAMAGWIAASIKNNKPVPEPVGDKEFSGHFALRMASSVHRAIALRAAYEGVSLNQWILGAIVAQLTRQDLAEQVADKVTARIAEEVAAQLAGLEVQAFAGVRIGTFQRTMRSSKVPSGRWLPDEGVLISKELELETEATGTSIVERVRRRLQSVAATEVANG